MIKKYDEFLKEMRLDKNKYVIVLSNSDLNADREFYLTIGKYEYDNLALPVNARFGAMTVQRVCDYIKKTFKENDLHFDRYWSGWITPNIYETKFYGNRSDLEKINKYYGITDDTLRVPTESEKAYLWRNLDTRIMHNGSDFLTYIDGTEL